MNNFTNSSVFQYALIACLAIALIVSQVFKLHMHIAHDESLSSSGTEHVLDIHLVTKIHKITDGSQHQDDFQDHHLTDIKVTPDSVAKKKVDSFSLDLLLFLFLSFFLTSVKLRSVFRQYIQTKLISTYYLISPPSRAPPIHSLV